ncbi:hypothetical protein H634G_00099 [Metarhizium anisopliae BRIP 53293]|uniref:Uncharacterized protein n=1 Tax=Metarhizium anisopliae BRIP 53293 TaxID=1291518 RepID=A0A0D9PEP0_METAN|nr:hypothetical protein H634G_00099 [Metarhizium anisopliae BRIP 53293]KJK88743.1 hypothetical protein H633G_07421 [Metarhizium anisopliae BRIP 53284]
MPVGGSLIADAPPTSPNWYYLPRGQNVAAGPSIWRRRMLTVRPSSAREPPGAFLGLQSTPTKISQLFTV